MIILSSCSRKKSQEAPQDSNPAIINEDFIPSWKRGKESQEKQENQETLNTDEVPANEEEGLGSDTLSFLEDEANFTSPIVEESGVEPVEKRLLDAYNRLKLMEFDTESFMPVNKEDSSVLIHYSNNIAIRLFYDQLYRLVKKEYWKMDSVDAAKITGTEEYSYEDQAKDPYEKRIQTEKALFVSKINSDGLITRTEKYDLPKGNKPLSLTLWTYDEKKRITSETLTQGSDTKKQVFDYKKSDEAGEEEDLPPDYKYYENGVLVTKTEYEKKGLYSTTIYFDTSNSVRTEYEDYVKKRDVYYIDGVEKRVKIYE